MSPLRRFVIAPSFILAVAALGGGCESCRKGAGTTKALFDEPPKEDVEKQTIAALRTAEEIASELCGFPAGGLTDVQVEVKSQLLSTSDVHVTGKPLPYDDDAGVDDAEAGPRDAGHIDVSRALVCAGVLKVVMDGDFTPDLQERKDWHLLAGAAGLEVKAIETPGVKFDEEQHRAPSGGHHHHHH